MKSLVSISFMLFSIFCSRADALLDKKIVVKQGAYKIVKNEVEDLRYHLSLGTGNKFSVQTKDSGVSVGIFIVQLHPVKDSIYYQRLDKNNQDAFLLEGNGKSLVRISAFTKQGLVNGVYTYLDKLGFRWYHPGEEWASIPQLTDVRLKLNEVGMPDFASRSFFGTFGTPRNRVIDKTGEVDKQWNLWSTRNRLGGSYNLQGHAWGYFFWRNIQTFLQHPEYAALVNRKRSELNSGGIKFCTSNVGLQELFVKDRIEELKKNMTASPGKPIYCVSVEPSDGEGFCECDDCKKLGNISTRVFLLANLVAKEFQKISPKAFVNLYAYNKHAAPPDIPLEKNVIVQIIPYGYQDYASPREMLTAWKNKSDNLFIYDYYGLPINNLDMPLMGDLRPEEFAKRIQFWHKQGIKGITLESSYSIGATGLGLYLFTRLSWNVKTDVQAEMKEYYERCYTSAANAVQQAQKILETDTSAQSRKISWSKTISLLDSELKKVKPDSLTDKRLSGFKAYLHYLGLLYEFQSSATANDTLMIDNLVKYTYGIFFAKMVHPFPLTEWMKNYGPDPENAKRCWDTFSPTKPGMKFSQVRQWRKEEIDEAFRKDVGR